MKLILICVCGCFASLMISCGGKESVSPINTYSEDSTIVSYLDSLNLTYTKDTSGIYSYIIKSNPTGKSQLEGTILSIYYDMEVLRGAKLAVHDSTKGAPIRMKQGVNAIYPIGIDRAVAYLKEGEEWGFVIPSRLAFVNYSSSLISEDAIVLIKISLEKIQDDNDVRLEDNIKIQDYSDSVKLADTVLYPLNQPKLLSNGMIYKRLIAGSGNRKPVSGNQLSITYKASLPYKEATPFDLKYAGEANPFVYSFSNSETFEGLDTGISEMEKGETALLVIPSLLAYSESVAVFPTFIASDLVDLKIIPAYASQVGPYEILIFEVKLLDIL
jgi:FKBP-type peptidyl-prolyl cis-trans isomerase